MPIGVIINALSVVIGGVIGAFAGHKLTPKFKENINMVFGLCSMGMGISTIVLMENMPAVIFSVIIGSANGQWFQSMRRIYHVGHRISDGKIKVVSHC